MRILFTELDYWKIPRHKKTHIEDDLIKIYAEIPNKDLIQDATMKTWKTLGKFDISAYINSG